MAVASEAIPVAGKNVLVTGASSGIGRVFSVRLAKQGCNVVLAARRKNKLEEVNEEIKNLKPEGNITPGKSVAIELDVSVSSDSIDAGIEKAWAAFGGIDVVVNNAEVCAGLNEDPLSTSDTDWDKILHTNVRGAGLVTQSVAKRMIEAKRGGSVINVASVCGIERGTVAGLAVYCASKSAVLQMTRVHEMELGPHNIRVNAIPPGLGSPELNEPKIRAH